MTRIHFRSTAPGKHRLLGVSQLAAWLLLAVPTLQAQATQKTVIFSADITIALGGQTFDDENAAEDNLSGDVTPVDTGMLPENVDLQAYHRTGDPAIGDLLVLDTAVDFPGGVYATPRKVIGLNGGVFSEVMNLADCGVPPGVQIDAMTSGDTMWFSFDIPVTLGGQTHGDEDVVALFDGCLWEQVLDGSDAGVATGLDVDGIHFQEETNLLLISFDAAGTVDGVSFDDEDVLGYSLNPGHWQMVYDSSAEHPGGEWNPADLDALEGTALVVVPPVPEPEPAPRLRVRPRHLEFELSQNDAPASKPFTVQAINGEIHYRIRRGASWLRANPDTGVSSGEVDEILAVVDPRGFPPGTYTKPLFVAGGPSTIQLMVTLNVTPAEKPEEPEEDLPEISEHPAVNAASFIPFGQPGHPVAEQSAVAIFGLRFADQDYIAQTIPLPLELGGVSVTFSDMPAGIFFASPGQLIVQMPEGLLGENGQAMATGTPRAEGSTTLVVRTPAGSSDPRPVQIATFSPAIYTVDQTGFGQGVVVFSNTPDLAAPVGSLDNSRPATAGDFLTIYANGLGPVEPEIENRLNSCDPDGQCLPDFSNLVLRTTTTRPVVTIGGVTVPDEDLFFSGLSALFVSLNEVVIRVPEGVPTGDEVPIVIQMNDSVSRDDVTIAVE